VATLHRERSHRRILDSEGSVDIDERSESWRSEGWTGTTATGGAAYKTAAGYLEPYGDYGEIAITSAGKTIAIWGEGSSYAGPGGVWFNRQP